MNCLETLRLVALGSVVVASLPGTASAQHFTAGRADESGKSGGPTRVPANLQACAERCGREGSACSRRVVGGRPGAQEQARRCAEQTKNCAMACVPPPGPASAPSAAPDMPAVDSPQPEQAEPSVDTTDYDGNFEKQKQRWDQRNLQRAQVDAQRLHRLLAELARTLCGSSSSSNCARSIPAPDPIPIDGHLRTLPADRWPGRFNGGAVKPPPYGADGWLPPEKEEGCFIDQPFAVRGPFADGLWVRTEGRAAFLNAQGQESTRGIVIRFWNNDAGGKRAHPMWVSRDNNGIYNIEVKPKTFTDIPANDEYFRKDDPRWSSRTLGVKYWTSDLKDCKANAVRPGFTPPDDLVGPQPESIQ